MVLSKRDVDRALDRHRDEAWTWAARHGWEALTWTGESPNVPLIDFQEYIWYRLPVKYLTAIEHKLEILDGLERLLDVLGYEHHAALCRSIQTKRIIQEWDRSETAARAMFRHAMGSSGVMPPDVDSLRWGSIMGMEESGVHTGASIMLEKAIAAGVFTPGAGNWRRDQKTVVEVFLRQIGRPGGLRHIDRIHAERIDDWLRRGGPARKRLLAQLSERLTAPERVPPGTAEALKPLIRLLELAEPALKLTQKGSVPPEQVRRLTEEFGWWDAPWRGPHREDDVPEIGELRKLARGAGLVKLSKGKLLITPAGRKAIADPEGAWSQLVDHVASGRGFTFFLMEPLLASLLNGPATISSLHEVMAEYAQESGWRNSNGEPIAADHMRWEFWPAVHPLMAVSAISGGWPSREVALTGFGIPTAIAILWHRAVAPRTM